MLMLEGLKSVNSFICLILCFSISSFSSYFIEYLFFFLVVLRFVSISFVAYYMLSFLSAFLREWERNECSLN